VEFFVCVTWVRKLVIAIQPEEVYFAGALSTLAGTVTSKYHTHGGTHFLSM
jgi:hypothetical protein